MAAATDQTYRSQKTLDIVFAATCILMLVSIVWMFAQDQYRDWKVEQREFRNVEEAIAQRMVLKAAPDSDKMTAIEEAEKAVVAARDKVAKKKQEVQPKINEIMPKKEKGEAKFQAIKADLDSEVSLYDIAVEKRNAGLGDQSALEAEVKRTNKKVDELRAKLLEAQNEVDNNKIALAAASKPLTDAEKEYADADDRLKELVGEFDRFHKLAEQKRWGFGDWFRQLPVLDAFASPLRIQQYTLEELPINYSFKYVTRYDRCTTCHMGIDRPGFSREALTELTEPPTPEMHQKLIDAKASIQLRQRIRKTKNGLDPNDLSLAAMDLTRAQIMEYAAHPRLDLFVDGNSPHPGQQFGCTICHGGQGSATDFFNASHMPNNSAQMAIWKQSPSKANDFAGHDWKSNHYWDYPMLPNRFIESSCVKCHHQVTDLIREGNRNEAPKLLKGYNLVRENGCFGCHEIAGTKNGRAIGPDMRLEPTPPLDAYTPAERVKLLADSQNPPGTMRKVGPSLRRLSEKTNPEWLRLWIKSPRTFRPSTKMPHFYLVSNNLPDVLPQDQKDFPDAEIHSIAHYLLKESKSYLAGSDKFREANSERLKQLEAKELRSEKENREIDEIKRRLELFKVPVPLVQKDKDGKETLHIVDSEGNVFDKLPGAAKDKEAQLRNGRLIFSEKGCLACHSNSHTETAGNGVPAIKSDAHFGPALNRIAAKLGTGGTPEQRKETGRIWLVQWIINPNISHPRTFMPVTHLTLDQANDVAVWLLNQNPDWPNEESKKLDTDMLKEPKTETLKKLARVFLERSYSPRETEALLDKGFTRTSVDAMRFDQDERELAEPLTPDKLKTYIGKKAVNQLGCFGCHDVPGFEYAKPIGTPLNDWGKKDAERLAFEDVVASVKKNHFLTHGTADAEGKPYGVRDGRTPYEKFFFDSLEHHQREGFLHQKLSDPRSFDFDRIRVWDDRLRMPQFRFARTERRPNESPESFEARRLKEESEAREAVMTFILGLVAEPIPARYVHQPPPDRMAEVKGRQVLDKFNCNSCHLVRSGVYDFKLSPENLQLLNSAYLRDGRSPTDIVFKDHNAWVGTNALGGPRVALRGVGATLVPVDKERRKDLQDNPEYPIKLPKDVKQLIEVRLTEAVRFAHKEGGKEEIRNIPSYSTVQLSARDLVYPPLNQLNSPHHGPFGGAFADLLVGFLMKLDPTKYPKDQANPNDSEKARPAAPPVLLREGEKTQPDWLFRFLRNPSEIRPQMKADGTGLLVLRMPKFNMSDDDAMALVNYFAAADRISNPAMGLNYPYFNVPERDPSYLLVRNEKYVERLRANKDKAFDQRLNGMRQFWGGYVKDQTVELESKIKNTEALVKELQDKEKEAKDDLKKQLTSVREDAEKRLATLNADLKALQAGAQDNFAGFEKKWVKEQAYAIDAFRMVTNKDLCIGCHQVGTIPPANNQGPPLELAWQRLRPEWTERWLANPQRFLPYKSLMPDNFQHGKLNYQNDFVGTSEEQVTAARDFLMFYPTVIDLPAIRNRPLVVPGSTGAK
ncbi:MAG: c-type cytochrome [Gemmataceae bacterium]|nr:c-type cytochrome [Gemmataceae bacterium]